MLCFIATQPIQNNQSHDCYGCVSEHYTLYTIFNLWIQLHNILQVLNPIKFQDHLFHVLKSRVDLQDIFLKIPFS